MDTAQRRATYEDLLQVPDHLIAEVVNGELITAPRPASAHARAASALTQDLGPFDRSKGGSNGPGGWWILFEPELHLDSDILVPDLAGWRRERMPVLEDVPYFTQTPDWVCEIVSPTTARIDRVRKMPIYAREQVGYLWLVDPSACTLEVYRLSENRWIVVNTYGGTQQVQAEPFEAVELGISRWWLERS